MHREFQKYLDRNPAPVLPLESWHEAVVIPAYNELEELPGVLRSLEAADPDGSAAVIVVVNYPPGADPSQSRALLEVLKTPAYGRANLFVIDAPAITGGVGRARKIGMDAFLHSRKPDGLHGSLIYSLDADSPVEPYYFTAIRRTMSEHPRAAGCTVGLHHRSPPELEAAIRRYEAYLDRYVAMLRRAGSPYAIQTVGSAFAVRCDAYLAAGGMRVKPAGEDFYFLEQIVKTGSVIGIDEVLVRPSARLSNRAPFGTGPALGRLTRGETLNEISDEAFGRLAALLAAAARPGALTRADALPEQEFLEADGFNTVWPKILGNTPDNDAARLRAFHVWFDGLKTLRFLHRASNLHDS